MLKLLHKLRNYYNQQYYENKLNRLIEDDTEYVYDKVVYAVILGTKYSRSFIPPALYSENFTTILDIQGKKVTTHNSQVYKVCHNQDGNTVEIIYRTRKSKSK